MGKLICNGICCDRAGEEPLPNDDCSEWQCDCACHFGVQVGIGG